MRSRRSPISRSASAHAYLDYERLTAQLRAWADAYPTLVPDVVARDALPKAATCGSLTIGPEPDRIRPAVWVDGNMHAAELAGSSVALAIAEDVLRVHLEPGSLDLRRRRSSNGCATCCSTSCRGSRPTAPSACCAPAARALGAARRARRARHAALARAATSTATASRSRCASRDPGGELVEARELPGLLVERTLEDDGPVLQALPRGHDRALRRQARSRRRSSSATTRSISTATSRGRGRRSTSRSAPAPFPASEPEARGIVEFATAHPEIFAWCDYHTFGGVLIRPLGHAPDAKMNQEDLAIFRQVEAWMTEHTGYPTVSGYDEFLYEPDKPLRGDLIDYAYNQRGALALRDRAVGPVHAARHAAAAEVRPVLRARHARRPRQARVVGQATRTTAASFPPWRPFEHPQLGRGRDRRHRSARRRSGTRRCTSSRRCARRRRTVFLRVAALAPRAARSRAIDRHPLPGGVTRVERARSRTTATSARYGLPSAQAARLQRAGLRDRATRDALRARRSGRARTRRSATSTAGATACTPARTCRRIPARAARRTRRGRRYLVRGTGALDVRVGACRAGFVTRARRGVDQRAVIADVTAMRCLGRGCTRDDARRRCGQAARADRVRRRRVHRVGARDAGQCTATRTKASPSRVDVARALALPAAVVPAVPLPRSPDVDLVRALGLVVAALPRPRAAGEPAVAAVHVHVAGARLVAARRRPAGSGCGDDGRGVRAGAHVARRAVFVA